eukprot:765539-Hanusia_phi.AAC.4
MIPPASVFALEKIRQIEAEKEEEIKRQVTSGAAIVLLLYDWIRQEAEIRRLREQCEAEKREVERLREEERRRKREENVNAGIKSGRAEKKRKGRIYEDAERTRSIGAGAGAGEGDRVHEETSHAKHRDDPRSSPGRQPSLASSPRSLGSQGRARSESTAVALRLRGLRD